MLRSYRSICLKYYMIQHCSNGLSSTYKALLSARNQSHKKSRRILMKINRTIKKKLREKQSISFVRMIQEENRVREIRRRIRTNDFRCQKVRMTPWEMGN